MTEAETLSNDEHGFKADQWICLTDHRVIQPEQGEHVEDIEYYEGPLLSTVRVASGLQLEYWCDVAETGEPVKRCNRWLRFAVTEQDIVDYKGLRRELRSFWSAEVVTVIDRDNHGIVVRAWNVPTYSLYERDFPEEGCFYDPMLAPKQDTAHTKKEHIMIQTTCTDPNEPVITAKKWLGIRAKTDGRTLTIIRLEGDDRARVQHHEGAKKQTTMLFSTLRANYRPEEPAPLPLLANIVEEPSDNQLLHDAINHLEANGEPGILRLDPRKTPSDTLPGFASTTLYGHGEVLPRTISITIPTELVPAFDALVEAKQKRIVEEGGSIDAVGVLIGIVRKAIRDHGAPLGQQSFAKT